MYTCILVCQMDNKQFICSPLYLTDVLIYKDKYMKGEKKKKIINVWQIHMVVFGMRIEGGSERNEIIKKM